VAAWRFTTATVDPVQAAAASAVEECRPVPAIVLVLEPAVVEERLSRHGPDRAEPVFVAALKPDMIDPADGKHSSDACTPEARAESTAVPATSSVTDPSTPSPNLLDVPHTPSLIRSVATTG
jgi:hypothetical protein